MPSHPEEPDLFSPAPEGWQWVVLHTRPRCEKKCEALSRQKEARMYLPCIDKVHTYGPRVRVHRLPLFRGYVFALLRKEDRAWFRQSPHVANVIEVVNERRFLETLRAVARALSEDLGHEVLPFLEAGRKVRITGGPLKGLEAVIAEVRGRSHVLLQIELIQQSLVLEVDAAFLEPMD